MPLYALADKTPQIADAARLWLAPGAHVIGDVHLGLDVGIWFGAALRGDNEPITIGDRSNIQENVVIHTDMGFPCTIGEDCTIGHSAILHGCTLGNAVLIGMGATVLNGAVLGDGCLVGANALVTEGKVFPANSLIVGAPARVARMLDDENLARHIASSAHYVKRAQNFQHELYEIPRNDTDIQ
ncbi:MAG: gamma carbonic anhydrase family protein [Paracoccaceae bacterium]